RAPASKRPLRLPESLGRAARPLLQRAPRPHGPLQQRRSCGLARGDALLLPRPRGRLRRRLVRAERLAARRALDEAARTHTPQRPNAQSPPARPHDAHARPRPRRRVAPHAPARPRTPLERPAPLLPLTLPSRLARPAYGSARRTLRRARLRA